MSKTIYLKSKFGIQAYRPFNWQQYGIYKEVNFMAYLVYKITGKVIGD